MKDRDKKLLKSASELLSEEQSAQLESHRSELRQFASSSDGKRLMQRLEQSGALPDALSGDPAAQRRLQELLRSPEGKRLATQLREILGK